jgi:hypothetical protein
MPNADVSHARPLRAVVPELGRTKVAAVGEDYSEFLICMVDDANGVRCLCVGKETQRWRGRPLAEKSLGRGGGGFVARTGARQQVLPCRGVPRVIGACSPSPSASHLRLVLRNSRVIST